MASSINHFSLLLLLLLTLFSSLHVHARESQFFSKVSNNNAKETEVLPNKEETLSKQDQDPVFIPQNQNNGYGLYGQESAQLPPATTTPNSGVTYTTTDNLPYKTQTQEPFDRVYHHSNANNNNYYYKKDGYVTEPQGTSDTRFMEKVYTTPNSNYYNRDKMYNTPKQGMGSDTKFMDREYTTTEGNNNYYNGFGNMYNTQKQGMSDTRFLENGKYFYDLNSEKYNLNSHENSRVVDSRYDYNNRGRYGNNENSFEYNSMEGYQNQEEYQNDRYMP